MAISLRLNFKPCWLFAQVQTNICCRFSSVRFFSDTSSPEEDAIRKPPKKPLPKYLDFFLSKRVEIKQNNPDAKTKDLTKIAAEMYRNLDEAEQEKLQKDYEARKEAYEVAYNEFISGLTEKQIEELNDARKNRLKERREKRNRIKFQKRLVELGKPKGAVTSYALFLKHELRGRKPTKENLAEVGNKWRQMTEEDKQEFSTKASEDHRRHETEFSSWLQKMVVEGNNDVVTKAQVKHELEKLGKPKPVRNMYTIFLMDKYADSKENIAKFQKTAAKEWKKMSEKQKETYVDRAVEDKERHSNEMEEWELHMEEVGLSDFVLAAQELLKPKPRERKVKPKKRAKKKTKKAAKKKTTKKTAAKKTATDKRGKGSATKKDTDKKGKGSATKKDEKGKSKESKAKSTEKSKTSKAKKEKETSEKPKAKSDKKSKTPKTSEAKEEKEWIDED